MGVLEGFEELYGTAPEGVWAAPGRVNLIGEYTDFNEGFVMPLALPHTAVAAVSRRTDGVLRLHSADIEGPVVELHVDDLAPRTNTSWAAYPAGVVWVLREAGHEVTGADIHLSSTVPTGAGLSSSAALEVVTALALNDLFELGLSGPELARFSQRAENDFVGVPCGIMDQTASACAEEGHALHLDCRDLSIRQIPFDLASEGLSLLVVDSRVKHALGDGEYAERREGCEEGARQLGVPFLRDVPYEDLESSLSRLTNERIRRYVRHVVSDDHRVDQVISLLDAGEVRAIGPVLTEGHASLRDDLRISCPELDLVVDTAVGAGALGARMTGGGFGGSAIVLVEASDADTVTKAVEEAFASAGYTAPRVFLAVPSAGGAAGGLIPGSSEGGSQGGTRGGPGPCPLGKRRREPDTLLMTPDTPAAEPDTASADDLRKLISSVRYVLWDLDGPICRLFAGHSAATIASELVSLLGPDEQFKLLPTKERLTKDPHGMLVSISRRHPDTEQIVKLEEWLTRQELKAVGSAVETPHAKDVIQAWADSGVRLAVSTNNSARAAAAYLAAKGLDRFFAHVYGRTRDLRLMKPDPHSLTLALEAMGADPSEALMLGDAPTDYVAAQAADVPFLGYAHDLLKVRAFLQARVEPSRIVRSLEEVWDVLR